MIINDSHTLISLNTYHVVAWFTKKFPVLWNWLIVQFFFGILQKFILKVPNSCNKHAQDTSALSKTSECRIQDALWIQSTHVVDFHSLPARMTNGPRARDIRQKRVLPATPHVPIPTSVLYKWTYILLALKNYVRLIWNDDKE